MGCPAPVVVLRAHATTDRSDRRVRANGCPAAGTGAAVSYWKVVRFCVSRYPHDSARAGRSPAAQARRRRLVKQVALFAGVAVTGAVAVIGIAAASGSGTSAAGQTISCPDVAGALPAVPAAAQAEVTSNLALLQKQIAEANARLVSSAGQGGVNFVQNAILGPLADKRVATIQRIEIAIGRHAAKPTGLESLATCTLTG